MAHLLKPNQVQVLTQNGEVKICLEITINLNSDGLTVSSQSIKEEKIKEKEEKNNEWMIPDFSDSPKIDFGK